MISTGSVSKNRKAHFNYTIIETIEAGLVLQGSEVKALRRGLANISGSYAVETDGSFFLNNALIPTTNQNGVFKHIEGRPRQLLLNKREMNKLHGFLVKKGYTLIPLEIYFNDRGLAKVYLGVAIGKTYADKRENQKKREWDREKQRILNYKNQ